jgi:peroxiredoxin
MESRRERRAAERSYGAQRRAQQTAARQQRTRLLAIITAVVVVLIVAGALVASQLNKSAPGLADPNALKPAPNTLAKGTTAPNFTLATVDGKKYSLSQYRGKAVLLEFFAVWCPHCQATAPILNQIDKTYQGKGMQTLAVLANPYGKDYDTSGGTDLRLANKSDITWFEKTFLVTHPSLIDPNFAVTNRYGANSYPTIYILDRQGKIRYSHQGEVSYADLSTALNQAMHS